LPDDPGALARVSRLAAELDRDLAALLARRDEIEGLVRRWRAEGSLPRPELVLVAVNLHGHYTALETLLERVARLLDEEVPAGPSWHQELIAQMSIELRALRPAVIPAAIVPELHELRRFRHFFRNAYVLELDPVKVMSHADRLLHVHPALASSLSALRRHLAALIEALAR
jgi:hypothetical protein